MSNTAKGWGKKGSKFWMQAALHFPELQKELNALIGDESMIWLSPLAGEAGTFDEYKLNQKNLPEELKFERDEHFYDFWPKGQPQWDAIAVSGDKKTLYLVEAKAHTRELNSRLSSSNAESTELIKKTLKEVHEKSFAMSGNHQKWENGYYQLANRLVFLEKLKEKLPFGTFLEVKLVLLNFVNDFSYKMTDEKAWRDHYYVGDENTKGVWQEMLGQTTEPDDVLVKFFDVSGRGIVVHPMTGEPLKREK